MLGQYLETGYNLLLSNPYLSLFMTMFLCDLRFPSVVEMF
jgi:hypothetical protein